MTIDWCWFCKRVHPMLDDAEFDAVWHAYRAREKGAQEILTARQTDTRSPRERLLELQKSGPPLGLSASESNRHHRYQALREAYESLTGTEFDGDDPKMIMHYRTSFYGPPCPFCRRLLRNKKAKQCFQCGMDWHDPAKVESHR